MGLFHGGKLGQTRVGSWSTEGVECASGGRNIPRSGVLAISDTCFATRRRPQGEAPETLTDFGEDGCRGTRESNGGGQGAAKCPKEIQSGARPLGCDRAAGGFTWTAVPSNRDENELRIRT